MFPGAVTHAVAEIERCGGTVERGDKEGWLLVNGELTVSLVIARCVELASGRLHWTVRFDLGRRADLTVALRMERGNANARDYYLLPRIGLAEGSLRLGEENGIFLDAFRFDGLGQLAALTARAAIKQAA